jgi:hypothetical protein
MTMGTLTSRRLTAGTAIALLVGAGTLTLGGCAKPAEVAGPDQSQAQQVASADDDTIDLVNAAADLPAAGNLPSGLDRKGLRIRLRRALHATWVTQGPNGTVTHQAIRGEVTAVSSSSITVRARDGFSLTYAVTADTRVRARAAGRGTDSSIGAVKVGARALVMGTGPTNPTAGLVVFHSGTPRPSSSSSPSATS